ncbi:Lgt Prolipoprotein diacylglyceryltransferase [Candidatus Nanopelagicaceae bacterium]
MRFAISTPTTSAVAIGPFTIHFYALCIIAGVAVAIWLGNRRFTSAHTEVDGTVADVAIYAVPAGVIGGRLYHVLTTPEEYFGSDGDFLNIFKIWKGGLGIWGAIALGAVVAYIAYQRIGNARNLPPFSSFAGALAPGLLLAQAIGRWGNWFNGELFGRPLDAPWALSIPQSLRPIGYQNFETFHPTFLYESLWCTALALVLIYLTPKISGGAIFALYVAGYSFARFFIEGVRIDQAHTWGGLRLNQYVSLILMSAGLLAFSRFSRTKR